MGFYRKYSIYWTNNEKWNKAIYTSNNFPIIEIESTINNLNELWCSTSKIWNFRAFVYDNGSIYERKINDNKRYDESKRSNTKKHKVK